MRQILVFDRLKNSGIPRTKRQFVYSINFWILQHFFGNNVHHSRIITVNFFSIVEPLLFINLIHLHFQSFMMQFLKIILSKA